MRWALLAGGGMVLGCGGEFESPLLQDQRVRILGIAALETTTNEETGELESCRLAGGDRLYDGPLVVDVSLWTGLELPLVFRNGGPENAEGSRYFDSSLTPVAFSVRLGCPTSSAIVEPKNAANILHRSNPNGPGCSNPPSTREGPDFSDAVPAPFASQTIFGGQSGIISVRPLSRSLAEDLDFELQLQSLAGECCRATWMGRCEGDMSGPSCDRVRRELRTLAWETETSTPALNARILELARRRSPPQLRLDSELVLRDPYGASRHAYLSMPLSVCRGCLRGLDPRLECIAGGLFRADEP
jgi:hypothetical protein